MSPTGSRGQMLLLSRPEQAQPRPWQMRLGGPPRPCGRPARQTCRSLPSSLLCTRTPSPAGTPPLGPADLDHVLLDAEWVAAAQDAEQLVIGDEEEAGEGVALGVQVVVEALLALLQALADVLQVQEAVRGLAASLDHGVFQGLAHDLKRSEDRGQTLACARARQRNPHPGTTVSGGQFSWAVSLPTTYGPERGDAPGTACELLTNTTVFS